MPLVPRTPSSASHVCIQHRAWHRRSDAAYLCTAPMPLGSMLSPGAHAAEGPALPPLGQQDVVHASQLDVDLQAEVGQGLRCGPLHILHLHTLCGHPQHRVPHALDLGCGARKTHTWQLSPAPLPPLALAAPHPGTTEARLEARPRQLGQASPSGPWVATPVEEADRQADRRPFRERPGLQGVWAEPGWHGGIGTPDSEGRLLPRCLGLRARA